MEFQPDWIRGLNQIDDFSGGSLFAKGFADEEVTFTRFGEMSVIIEDDGELTVDFPGLGVYCIYLPDGTLGFACVEISTFLGNVPIEDLDILANRGEDVLDFLRNLQENREELFVSVFPESGELSISLEGEEGTVSSDEEVCESFSGGVGGDIKLGLSALFYHVIDLPNEFRISIGERMGDMKTMVPISFGHKVDVSGFVRDTSPERYRKLAKQIFPVY